jgi:pyruvate formate lyase activating enzyme
MEIKGLWKANEHEFPGGRAYVVSMQGCNFKCPFCLWKSPDLHGSGLPGSEEQPVDEDGFFALLSQDRKNIDGVCLSGGEPTMSHELPDFIRKIRELGLKVRLETNGSNPRMLAELLDVELVDSLAMDIKNDENRYAQTSGLPRMLVHNILNRVCESIDIIKSSDIDYVFRTTVVRGFQDAESFEGIARLIDGAEKYEIDNYRPTPYLAAKGMNGFDRDELEAFADIVRPHVGSVEIWQ